MYSASNAARGRDLSWSSLRKVSLSLAGKGSAIRIRHAPPYLDHESGTRKSWFVFSASRSNVLYLSLIWLPPVRNALRVPNRAG